MNSGRADSGRVSVFLAIALTALLTIIGLSYDAAGQVRTLHTAQLLAAEAARAAGQSVDVDLVLSDGVARVDPASAAEAAAAYLQQAGSAGTVSFNADLTVITVTVQETYQPVFLGLFGAGDRVVTGRSTATLVSG